MNVPKRILIFAVTVLTLGVVAVFGTDYASAEKGHGVAICHFAGHDGDFVTTGKGYGCQNLGGNVIIVSRKACESGHGARGDCNLDNVGWLDPEVIGGN